MRNEIRRFGPCWFRRSRKKRMLFSLQAQGLSWIFQCLGGERQSCVCSLGSTIQKIWICFLVRTLQHYATLIWISRAQPSKLNLYISFTSMLLAALDGMKEGKLSAVVYSYQAAIRLLSKSFSGCVHSATFVTGRWLQVVPVNLIRGRGFQSSLLCPAACVTGPGLTNGILLWFDTRIGLHLCFRQPKCSCFWFWGWLRLSSANMSNTMFSLHWTI